MAKDHSITYRRLRLRNIPHIKRLNDIKALISSLKVPPGGSYADFGCSNGYVTDQVRQLVRAAHTTGFDHLDEHFEEGRRRHPELEFATIDLNRFDAARPQFDFVTCFETLEHTGNLGNALRNVVHAVRPGGIGVISVPVEVGFAGIVKFLVKVGLYGYTLKELPQRPSLRRDYVMALMKGERIGKFRSESRSHWGTHFGFDTRDVDDLLAQEPVNVSASNRGFTRFWVIRRPA
jgi:2-polyprenyl-3-methyl-5-hydroxy-6-metoxy-1,4-benzoquinol methylase